MTNSDHKRPELDQTSNAFELGAVIRRLTMRGYSEREIARILGVAPEAIRTARVDASNGRSA